MAECAKTHLQQCGISKNFLGRTPGPPAFRGRTPGATGEGREEGRGGPWPPAPKTIIRHCARITAAAIECD